MSDLIARLQKEVGPEYCATILSKAHADLMIEAIERLALLEAVAEAARAHRESEDDCSPIVTTTGTALNAALRDAGLEVRK